VVVSKGVGLFKYAGGVYLFLVGCWVLVCCLLSGAVGCLVLYVV